MKNNKQARTQLSSDFLKEKLRQHEASKPLKPAPLGLGLFGDVTPAALPHTIHELSIKSAGIFTSEGEEFFSNGLKKKTSLLNSPWSGDRNIRTRVSTGQQNVHYRLSMHIQMQPSVAEDVFGKSNRRTRGTGFLARTLITFPPSRQGYRGANPIITNDPRDKSYRELIGELLRRNVAANQDPNYHRILLSFSDEAKELAQAVSHEIERETAPNGRFHGFGDHAGKWMDNALRQAAVLHVLEYGFEESISRDTLWSSMLLCSFYSDEFIRIFRELPQEEIDAQTLDLWFSQKRQAGYRYLLKRFVLAYKAIRPAARLDAALSILVQRGHISLWAIPRCNRNGRPTKPTEVIDLYPNHGPNHALMYQVASYAY